MLITELIMAKPTAKTPNTESNGEGCGSHVGTTIERRSASAERQAKAIENLYGIHRNLGYTLAFTRRATSASESDLQQVLMIRFR